MHSLTQGLVMLSFCDANGKLIPLKKPDSRGVASIFQSMRLTL